ncbi:glycosyltransferase [Microbacterium resistens]|uniref:Glycosyltransferase n=1 Tax=Microbacterium resistens TaxID=156977 RepID=A0ABY3RMV0_9MICO|nr:glycosyltransferase family 2 protein [Microbacterium resistens]UGS24966.1 glycosyltransferase [Microbacterium resistens]
MTFSAFLSMTILFSLVMGALFLSYVIAIVVPFLRRTPGTPGDASTFTWHFVIPCRDEEAVIGHTISYLEENFPHADVWVVDDDSEDSTASIVRDRAARNPHIHLIQRRRPEARQGKAHALNYAWLRMREIVGDVDLARTILVVVDADGRPSANLLDICAGPDLFGAEDIAAVQVEVRMSNRDERRPYPGEDWLKNLAARTFVRMQDIEFRGPISAIQLSRRFTRTVNVGGNGQLARWSALAEISTEQGPWRGALLEDFELGLHLLLGGWRNAYTPDAWVDQEALYSLPRYLTQRARWAQGTMQCFQYLPKVWASRHLSNLGALEVTYFLLQPWLQLVGTIVYPWPLIIMAYNAIMYPALFGAYMQAGGAILLLCYAIIGIGEFAVWGFLYRIKSEPESTVLQATGWGLSYMLYIYLIYAVAWKAFLQVLRRQSGWAKTIRNAEQTSPDQLVARLK